jgi:hypothetical protein
LFGPSLDVAECFPLQVVSRVTSPAQGQQVAELVVLSILVDVMDDQVCHCRAMPARVPVSLDDCCLVASEVQAIPASSNLLRVALSPFVAGFPVFLTSSWRVP